MAHVVLQNNLSPPSYYMMDGTNDVFRWLTTIRTPEIPLDIMVPAISIWATAFRYVRRCLWKEDSLAGKAHDARKAATCLLRLAEILEERARG